MLKQIAHKSQNTLENQGSKSSAAAPTGDRELFEQFSDILDKIATSLNRAKNSNKEQSVADLSASLSQAAAQQVVQKPQPVSQQKLVKEEGAADSEKTQAKTESAKVERTESKEVQKSTTTATEMKKVEGEKPVATQNVEKREAKVEEKGVKSEEKSDEHRSAEQVTTETPAADGESAKTAPETEQCSQETKPVASSQEEQPVAEEGDQSIEAAPVAEEHSVEPLTQAPTKPETVERSNQSADAVKTEVETAEPIEQVAEAVTNTEDSQLEEPVRTATAVKSDVSVAGNIKDAAAVKDMSNQEILAQSAQELLQQIILFSPLKAMAIEPSTAQKLLASASGIQSASATNSGQSPAGSFAAQVKTSSSFVEKAPAKELPRSAALRTMERVESALKEVARSKDGKTISLRLDPPSLGSVKIDVTLKDGNLHARFVAESAHVSALLRDQSHELQQMLRKAGIDAESITISVASDPSTDTSSNTGFSSFDKQLFEQPEKTFRGTVGAFGQSEAGSESAAAASSQRAMDHWVA